MCNSQRQKSFAALLPGTDSPVQRLTVAFDAGWQDDLPSREREEEWQRRVNSLQEWIAELLIRNQQLRMSLLDSANNPESIEN